MDIISSRDIEVTNLAMNGLIKRQNAIASNAANVMTPGYQRKEVSFEEQLERIIERDDLRKEVRAYNSSLDPEAKAQLVSQKGFIPVLDSKNHKLSTEQLNFLAQTDYDTFKPEIIQDFSKFDVENDNNVDLEKEMTDMAKTGIKYNALATLESRSFTKLSEIIKSGGD